jgi:tripartite-type tricarboxylate transporter receptor subunit TctC
MRISALFAAIVLALTSGSGAHAQPFPSHPVTIIVPFPAGGPTDTLARILADACAQPSGSRS